MSSINHLDKRSQTIQHKQELKRLQDQNKLELDKIKINHELHKGQIKLSQNIESNQVHKDHEIKLAKQTINNEKTYDKVQTSLNDVKLRTKTEKDRIIKDHGDQLTSLKSNHESLARGKKEQNEFMMQDMNHQASVQINKLQRRIDAKESELAQNSQENLTDIKVSNKKVEDINKTNYSKKQNAQSVKFQNALMKLTKKNTTQLNTEEKKHQTKMNTRQSYYQEKFDTQELEFRGKQTKQVQLNEKKYVETNKKSEKSLQNLLSRKENIINNLRQMLKKEAIKEVELDKDPFYQFTDLNPKIQLNEEKNGYIVSINVPKHEADKIKLTGYDREIKISMDRDFSFTKVKESGAKGKINRVESFTSKIPVEYILDSKNIEKSYSDGVLKFKLGFA